MNTPLDELQWKSPEWIQAFGLRTENVLDYFAESPFFEKTANNHVIKMQRQFSQINNPPAGANGGASGSGDGEAEGDNDNDGLGGVGRNGSTHGGRGQDQEFSHLDPIRRSILAKYPMHAALEKELMKLRGVEYVLSSVREPDFWVIKKQSRTAATTTELIQAYYIIGANVYQSPSVFKVVQSRLLSCSYHISSTLSELQTMVEFQPSQGVQYKSIMDMPSTSRKQSNNIAGSVPGTASAGLNMPSGPTNPGGRLNSGVGNSGMLMGGPGSVIPQSVGMTGTTGQTGQTGATSRFENGSSRSSADIISTETLDRLMITSIKSKPEYI
ncbi:Mediator of RNA polymerase II transcription subunit 6 [Nakaseomyces bracarensis]|uniref:Mediator of RNA polymerase II transcription subunit 6 n=1 Tax=Nakaseomyces bracarensis TaxID=273131 RepID=A0ABR4P079_9SACH